MLAHLLDLPFQFRTAESHLRRHQAQPGDVFLDISRPLQGRVGGWFQDAVPVSWVEVPLLDLAGREVPDLLRGEVERIDQDGVAVFAAGEALPAGTTGVDAFFSGSPFVEGAGAGPGFQSSACSRVPKLSAMTRRRT